MRQEVLGYSVRVGCGLGKEGGGACSWSAISDSGGICAGHHVELELGDGVGGC